MVEFSVPEVSFSKLGTMDVTVTVATWKKVTSQPVY